MDINDYTDSADDPEVSQRVVAAIQSGLREHNRSRHTDPQAGRIVLAAHGAGQEVVAGLLCGLMASTNVAGRPESYFREPDEQLWAARWDIARSSDGAFERSDFVRGALAAGRTDNGVFAARIMWGTLDYLFDRLRSVYPAPAAGDLDLLNLAFGQTRALPGW